MQSKSYRKETFVCACGKTHTNYIDEIIIGTGVISELSTAPERLGIGKHAMLITDSAVMGLMGDVIVEQLEKGGCSVTTLVYSLPALPDERGLIRFLQTYTPDVDFFVAAGTGVVNDITRYYSSKLQKPYISIPTAPSMDGYSAKVALLFIDGVKQTLDATYPKAIYADIAFLKNAPKHLLAAGVGDLAAKLTACADWKLSAIVNHEYCCDYTMQKVIRVAEETLRLAPGLVRQEEKAVFSLMDGLLFSGIGMQYVDSSRPAAGAEHHITHFWGMLSGAPQHLHGLEVAVGTLIMLRAYEALLHVDFSSIDVEKTVAGMPTREAWLEQISRFCREQVEVIQKQQKDKLFDRDEIKARIQRVIEHEDEIKAVLRDTVKYRGALEQALKILGAPTTAEELGISKEDQRTGFLWAKEMRPKYVILDLAYDLGVLGTLADQICS